jgi:hypothetical protein
MPNNVLRCCRLASGAPSRVPCSLRRPANARTRQNNHTTLSRRDEMRVARHEMPGKWANMIRPVRNGVVRGAVGRHAPRSK